MNSKFDSFNSGVAAGSVAAGSVAAGSVAAGSVAAGSVIVVSDVFFLSVYCHSTCFKLILLFNLRCCKGLFCSMSEGGESPYQ